MAGADAETPLTFVVYGDTRFSKRNDVVNAFARRALVGKIAREKPAAILIGGDLVFDGSNPDDYDAYKSETQAVVEPEDRGVSRARQSRIQRLQRG